MSIWRIENKFCELFLEESRPYVLVSWVAGQTLESRQLEVDSYLLELEQVTRSLCLGFPNVKLS